MPLQVKHLGIQGYRLTLEQMRHWVDARAQTAKNKNAITYPPTNLFATTPPARSINPLIQAQHTSSERSPDEIWIVQHPSVYTQGQSNRHISKQHTNQQNDQQNNQQSASQQKRDACIRNIPVVQSDRGGKITYHGPGQIIAYLLLDLKRKNWSAQTLVKKTEASILSLLDQFEIPGHLSKGAPGVYVNQQKIASLGFRIRRGFSYHGLSLNVDMDLRPFNYIAPCGYKDITMTQMKDQIPSYKAVDLSAASVARKLTDALKYQLETCPKG